MKATANAPSALRQQLAAPVSATGTLMPVQMVASQQMQQVLKTLQLEQNK